MTVAVKQVSEPIGDRRELARRASGGIEVALYWSPLDNGTTVEVRGAGSEDTIVFAVAPEHALEAFHHPFARLGASLNELVAVANTQTKGGVGREKL